MYATAFLRTLFDTYFTIVPGTSFFFMMCTQLRFCVRFAMPLSMDSEIVRVVSLKTREIQDNVIKKPDLQGRNTLKRRPGTSVPSKQDLRAGDT